MRWVLDPNGCYYTGAWWDCVDGEHDECVGSYRMTEHGRWDVRSWYFTLEFAKKNEAKLVFLSPTEYTETEVRRIVETAWRVGKNEENENE